MKSKLARPKRNLIPLFSTWLQETDNAGGMVDTVKKRGKCLDVKLKNVTDLIHFTVLPTTLNISVYYHRECYDFLKSMDIDAAITSEGKFYCRQCLGDTEYFDTEYDLCAKHTFVPAIDYIRSIALPGKKLLLQYKPGSFSAAFVVNEKDISSASKKYSTVIVDVCNLNVLV